MFLLLNKDDRDDDCDYPLIFDDPQARAFVSSSRLVSSHLTSHLITLAHLISVCGLVDPVDSSTRTRTWLFRPLAG